MQLSDELKHLTRSSGVGLPKLILGRIERSRDQIHTLLPNMKWRTSNKTDTQSRERFLSTVESDIECIVDQIAERCRWIAKNGYRSCSNVKICRKYGLDGIRTKYGIETYKREIDAFALAIEKAVHNRGLKYFRVDDLFFVECGELYYVGGYKHGIETWEMSIRFSAQW